MKDLLLERVGRFIVLPIVHHSYEFTLAVRSAFALVKPAAVAVEYPAALQSLIEQGIRRLPRISVLIYGDPKHYIRLEPVDAMVEAARLAIENDIGFHCIDSAAGYPEIYDPAPDTFALRHIGHARYCKMFLEKGAAVRLEEDESRERAMAFHLQELGQQTKGDSPILVVCGLRHLSGVIEELNRPQAQPFDPAPRHAKLFHLSSASLGEIMGCFPFVTAVYERIRSGAVQQDFSAAPALPFDDSTVKLRMVEGMKTESLGEFAARAHSETAAAALPEDRSDLLARYIFQCRRYYEQEIGDQISPQSMLLLQQFARKYASIKNMLLPDFYEMLIAGRGCVSSHFCYRMWEIGTFYPPQSGPSEIEIIELRAEDVFDLVNKVRMNPLPPLRPRDTLPRFLRRKDKRGKADEDRKFSPYSICSHQPEDLVIEGYGNYLRTKGKSMLSEERKKVLPFETSLLDGIDLRETIRNWHTGQLFVQECATVRGEISSIVVIFDEDGSKYPYTMTWLGEHYQESDMAFYATDPQEREVGPGIRKSVYGGFLMTMPPGRLFDVFGDPAYRYTQNYAERLLLAGIDYSLEKYVLYAAMKPPRPSFQTIAGRYGRRILYVPLAQLSPVMLQKIRGFHILSDKSVRDYAKDYIW